MAAARQAEIIRVIGAMTNARAVVMGGLADHSIHLWQNIIHLIIS